MIARGNTTIRPWQNTENLERISKSMFPPKNLGYVAPSPVSFSVWHALNHKQIVFLNEARKWKQDVHVRSEDVVDDAPVQTQADMHHELFRIEQMVQTQVQTIMWEFSITRNRRQKMPYKAKKYADVWSIPYYASLPRCSFLLNHLWSRNFSPPRQPFG